MAGEGMEMVSVSVAKVSDTALEWAVAKADAYDEWWAAENPCDGLFLDYERTRRYSPSTNWAQGGPIIEQGQFDSESPATSGIGEWVYSTYNETTHERVMATGRTALVAAMRCFVASRLGDTIDVPACFVAVECQIDSSAASERPRP